MDDLNLAISIREGVLSAFDELWIRYRPAVRSVLSSAAVNRDELEDVLQETAFRALEALRKGRYEHRGQMLAWLCSIGRNACMDLRRRSRYEIPLEGEADILRDHSISPERQVLTNLLVEFLERQLCECFGETPSGRAGKVQGRMKRLAFVWYYADGYTLDEVAELAAYECRRHGAQPPTASALNNWLCAGRLLHQLVEHLVTDHADTLESLNASLLADTMAPAPVSTPVTNGESRSASDAAVRKLLVHTLTRDIARSLHESRKS